MPRRVPTAEQLASLRSEFRMAPPSTARDFKAAGVRAGVSEAVARRAWARGWPGIEAIESQVSREQAVARQSAEVLKVERLVGTMKTTAVLLQTELRRLLPAVRTLTEGLAVSLGDLALQPENALKALHRISKVTRDVTAITAKAIELDRLVAGEATSIIGHKPIAADPVDLAEAQAVSERLARAVRRAQARPTDDQARETDDVGVDTRVN